MAVIAGKYENIAGAATTFSPINLFNVNLNKNGKAGFSFPAAYNSALLVIEGKITVNGAEEVPADHFALFQNEGEEFGIATDEGATVLIMSGRDLLEPIAAHGPFVMNTRQEILQAFEDFQNGKFGYLKD